MPNTTAPTTPAVVPNTFNLEDKPQLAAIFVTCLILSHVYVLYKVACLFILHRRARVKGIDIKIPIAAFPVLFATLLLIRSTTHNLNNACETLVPFAYLIRYAEHAALFCFQFRAYIMLKWFSYFGTHADRRRNAIRIAFPCLYGPGFAFTITMWVLGLGIQQGGVCTLGRKDQSDLWLGSSYWAWASNFYELAFLLVNVYTFCFLNKSMISQIAKEELRWATAISTTMLIVDSLFRFNGIQKLAILAAGGTTAEYKLFATVYSIFNACVYVNVTSCLFAFSFERRRIAFFNLNPFMPRFYRLLCGTARFTRAELNAYDAVRSLAACSARHGSHRVQMLEQLRGTQTVTIHNSVSRMSGLSIVSNAASVQFGTKSSESDASAVEMQPSESHLPRQTSSGTVASKPLARFSSTLSIGSVGTSRASVADMHALIASDRAAPDRATAFARPPDTANTL